MKDLKCWEIGHKHWQPTEPGVNKNYYLGNKEEHFIMKKRSLILTDRNYVQMYQTPEHQKLGAK